jgi:hypothetical protein
LNPDFGKNSSSNAPIAFCISGIGRSVTMQDVASRIVGSDEAQVDQVDAIFAVVLHRNPENSGRAFRASFLDNGGTETQVIAALASSAEYLEDNGLAPPPR